MSWSDLTHAVLPQSVFLPLWVKLSWALVASEAVPRSRFSHDANRAGAKQRALPL